MAVDLTRNDHFKVGLGSGKTWEQLPMFMTAREIQGQYQALDGDRDYALGMMHEPDYVPGNPRKETDDELYDRKRREAEQAVVDNPNFRFRSEWANAERTAGGGLKYKSDDLYEDDREDLSTMVSDTQAGENAEYNRENMHITLAEDLVQNGVQNPISLQLKDYANGSQGRPQILGGHHRLAVMAHYKPDTLMPVAHFPSVSAAKTGLKRSY